jgi:hypothetical protein
MMGFLARNSGYALLSGVKRRKDAAKGGINSPFSAKAGAMRRPLAALDCP